MKHRSALAAVAALILAGCGGRADDPAPPPPAERLVRQAGAPEPADTAATRRERRRMEILRRQREMPRFEQFPARDTFTGTPAPVDLASAEGARQFRTALAEGAAKGPNFAGHYTFVGWGCGSNCQSFAIVDARTGRVAFGPEPLQVGASHRLDSELLIANPPEEWMSGYGADATDAVGGMARSVYYRWDGRRLIALDSLPIGHDAKW